MTNQEIETAFELWYDSRKGMPPSSLESFKAGWSDAIKSIDLTRSEIQLIAGEISAQEWRTVSAVLKYFRKG